MQEVSHLVLKAQPDRVLHLAPSFFAPRLACSAKPSLRSLCPAHPTHNGDIYIELLEVAGPFCFVRGWGLDTSRASASCFVTAVRRSVAEPKVYLHAELDASAANFLLSTMQSIVTPVDSPVHSI